MKKASLWALICLMSLVAACAHRHTNSCAPSKCQAITSSGKIVATAPLPALDVNRIRMTVTPLHGNPQEIQELNTVKQPSVAYKANVTGWCQTEEGGHSVASPLIHKGGSSIGISGIGNITMQIVPMKQQDFEKFMSAPASILDTVSGPPQSFDISGVYGWCQLIQGAYHQKQWIIPESFDEEEDNKPYRIVDESGPFVYVTTMPTTADNQAMMLYSYSEFNDIVSVTRVTMHRQGAKFVSDYVIPTDEPNYVGTIIGESGQTYRCVFVEENGHLTIKPDDLYGDFDKNGTVDSLLPFFQRYPKDKFAP